MAVVTMFELTSENWKRQRHALYSSFLGRRKLGSLPRWILAVAHAGPPGRMLNGVWESVAIEEIIVDGERLVTLRELLRPGLKAVFVGLNPSPTSVARGHYYQGRHGRIFWNCLFKSQILPALPKGLEDDAAFEQGYGFIDLIRRPTISAKQLTHSEKSKALLDFTARLSKTGDRPLIVFRYKGPWVIAGSYLSWLGYPVFRFPGPYTERELANDMLMNIRAALESL